MLPKVYRLDSAQIPNLAYKGRKISGEYFDIRTSPTTGEPKFAISISLKVDKRATVRNLIKRRLRVAILELIREQKVPVANYLIIVRKPQLAEASIDVKELLLKALV